MSNSRYLVLSLCGLMLPAMLLLACSKSGMPGRTFKVAFVTNNAADFWTIARRGCEKADEELDNVEVEFRIPSDGTAIEQKHILDDLLAKGIDGVAISPVDPLSQAQMLNETARRTLLMTQDSDAPDSDRLCYLGTDNPAAGRQLGALIKEALPGGGKIMVFVGKPDAQNARERYEGMKEALAGSKVEILDLRSDDTDRVRAKSNASDTLIKYPDVAALVGLWAYNGPAILSAVKDAGKVGQVKIICFDEESQTLAGIREGAIYATVVQQPYEFGYQSVRLLARVLQGQRDAIPASKQILIPTLVIKRDNVDQFAAKINRLRN
ncbi:MAG TPA: sugar-binding protein [Pyrinomonadaceae bacterium]|nr:sugar-binding protein [Pyrinomonadaceae bacterium]